ncbi:hypothetical protein C5167_028578 [Papaver somniferum]|uniref:E3 ubiquitin-protein ligase AIRP2-like isoform X1 n=2 Tax=Papaver somniferum TaxID=3469 RepID=UPI000E6F8CDE|nr:E3 ubiquitin-protein ligase AIRP2-like isoform X1 [Papaver somniferum]XP_026439816.1 E3 ubiquitin-protein ligase AIRP2-like isoform X1 [Papaver somniferum]RZC90751.1 hypothetical protein C5167_028578 [Papaver somniferum]
MRKSFKDSFKALQADIQHANSLASFYPREYDGVYIQMRLSYSPAARLFLFFVQWADFNLAGALGLLRIFIYKAYVDGKTTMCIQEKTASIREFYAVIFPSLLQLERGISDAEDQKQKEICATKYKKLVDTDSSKMSEIDQEREEECGICMEMNFKVVLPNCNHSLCMNCYRDWHARSKSCPFCRDSLKRVDSADLWIFTDSREIIDTSSMCKENIKRLFMYVDKLPAALPDPHVCISTYDSSRQHK